MLLNNFAEVIDISSLAPLIWLVIILIYSIPTVIVFAFSVIRIISLSRLSSEKEKDRLLSRIKLALTIVIALIIGSYGAHILYEFINSILNNNKTLYYSSRDNSYVYMRLLFAFGIFLAADLLLGKVTKLGLKEVKNTFRNLLSSKSAKIIFIYITAITILMLAATIKDLLA